jgi:hypothetical protein
MMAGFFLKENIGKIQTAHGTPLGLWGEFLGTLFPVLILFGVLLPSREFLAAWKRNRHRWLGYTLIPALFFTLFPYRVNTYLYLLTPAVIWVIMSSRGALERRARVAGTLAALASGLLLFLIWRLFAGGWIAPGLCLSFGAILPCWAWAHFRASLSGVAMTSLVLVNLIRLSAVGIGEFDLAGLREFMQERQTSYAFWMEQEDIWHEVGLISSATGKRISILKNGEEVRKHLLAGGAVLLEDSQKSPLSGVSCRDWFRLKKRIKFPVRELLTRGLSIRDGALRRAYQICWK